MIVASSLAILVSISAALWLSAWRFRFSAGVSRETTQRALQLLQTRKGYQKIYDSGGVLVLKRPDVPDVRLGGNR